MTENTNGPDDEAVSIDAPLHNPDRDGVDALHDTEAEEGDEQGLADLFVIDTAEAEEIGADLDSTQEDEPLLD